MNRHASPFPSFGLTALCAFAAVVLADVLFYRQPAGWTYGLYLLFLLALLIGLDRGKWLSTAPGMLLAAATSGLVVSFVYQPGILAVMLALAGLVTFALGSRCGWAGSAWRWMCRWTVFLTAGWKQLILDHLQLSQDRTKRLPKALKTVLAFLVMLFPVFLIAGAFVAFFSMANPIISNWLERGYEAIDELLSSLTFPSVARIALWILVAFFCWALMRFTPKPRKRGEGAETVQSAQDDAKAVPVEFQQIEEVFLNPFTIGVGLGLFNVLFAVQNLLDISYLWAEASLPEGMTYAGYAHRGAYPLVGTAILSALIMLIAFRPRLDGKHSRVVRLLVYVWIAQNVFLLVSAAWRLNLYVAVYSLTRLRVAAGIWMLLVALGFVWICLRFVLKRSNTWLVNVNFLTLVSVIYVSSFLNISGGIAWYNCRHCAEVTGEGAELDFHYLWELGSESIPPLLWVRSEVKDRQFAGRAARVIKTLKKVLEDELCNWRGWTWRRHKLRESLLRAKL